MDVKAAIDKLEKIREKKGLNKQKFAVIELDIPYQTYMRWLNGTNTPSGDNLAKIYEYIGNRVSERITEKFKETDEVTIIRDHLLRTKTTYSKDELKIWDQLSDEEKKKIDQEVKETAAKEYHEQIEKYREKVKS